MPCRSPYSNEEEGLANIARVLLEIRGVLGDVPLDGAPSYSDLYRWDQFQFTTDNGVRRSEPTNLRSETIRETLDDLTKKLCAFCRSIQAGSDLSVKLKLPDNFQTVAPVNVEVKGSSSLVWWWANHRFSPTHEA